jgi:hypothetical protein
VARQVVEGGTGTNCLYFTILNSVERKVKFRDKKYQGKGR